MQELLDFLRARLDERERELAEDERVALASMRELLPVGYFAENAQPEQPVDWPLRSLPPATRQHIARHDPARVLAEVERGRREIEVVRAIIDEHNDPISDGPKTVCGTCRQFGNRYDHQPWPCMTLRLLVQPYADQPGFREEWRS